jgi:hypothetical protein
MKKLFSVIFTFILASLVFAESYKVEDVTGKVFLGTSHDEVQIGQILDSEEIINVRPNASITLVSLEKIERRTYKKPTNRISIGEVWISSAIGKQGLKKGTIVKASNIAPPVESTRKGVATAASRASEAKEDFDWDE